MLMALLTFSTYPIKCECFRSFIFDVEQSILYSITWICQTQRKKSQFMRPNEKCPKMHLIEMKIRMKAIIYRTNDVYVYIIQKVSTVLCPSRRWRQQNTQKCRRWSWRYGVCCRGRDQWRSLITHQKFMSWAQTKQNNTKNDQRYWLNSFIILKY